MYQVLPCKGTGLIFFHLLYTVAPNNFDSIVEKNLHKNKISCFCTYYMSCNMCKNKKLHVSYPVQNLDHSKSNCHLLVVAWWVSHFFCRVVVILFLLHLFQLKLMATVHQTQPTIQLLLSTSDFVGALDLISTTQEVLQQELAGIQSFRYRHLSVKTN